MLIQETFTSAITALKSNKVRSILTMLGVIIGVFAVVSLVSVGIGIKSFVTEQFEGLGSNLIIVAPGIVDFSDDPAKAFSRNKLEDKHLKLIETYASDYVLAVTPSVRTTYLVTYKNQSYNATVIGTNYTSDQIINYTVDAGRNFSRSEQKADARVVLIGDNVAKELFGSELPLGKKVRMDGISYEVIGTLKQQGRTFDDNILLPYTTLMTNAEIEVFSSMAIKAKDASKIKRTMRAVELALLRDLDDDDFSVLSQTDILESIQSILGTLTLGIGAIAGISLLVGGIGIMNIMLVSVTERVKEIGLRKAVGATPTNIALQFLIEATILSLIGGSIGIFLGWLAAQVIKNFVSTSVPLGTVLLAFGFSAVVGVIFGTYPAIQASKKDPIEALTFE